MFLFVGFTDQMDVLEDVAHELLACDLPLLLVLGDEGSSLLSIPPLLQLFSPLLPVGFVLSSLLFLPDGIVGVQLFHEVGILERVLLVLDVDDLVLLGSSDNRLDFIGIDDPGQISVTHHCSVHLVSLLIKGLLRLASEESIEGRESTLGPDDESSQLASGSQLQKVHSVHVAHVHSRHVPEGLQHLHIVIGVDDQRSSPLLEPSVPHLSFTSPQLLALDYSDHIVIDVESLQEGNGFLGLFDAFQSVFDYQRQFGDVLHLVSSGKHQRSHSGGSNSSSSGMSPLLNVHLPVPSSEGLQGSKHSSLPDHVSESSLSGSAGTGSTDSGNSGYSSSGSPRLSTVSHACLVIYSMSLSLVLGQVGVYEMYDIISDGSSEYSGHHYLLLHHFKVVFHVEH